MYEIMFPIRVTISAITDTQIKLPMILLVRKKKFCPETHPHIYNG